MIYPILATSHPGMPGFIYELQEMPDVIVVHSRSFQHSEK